MRWWATGATAFRAANTLCRLRPAIERTQHTITDQRYPSPVSMVKCAASTNQRLISFLEACSSSGSSIRDCHWPCSSFFWIIAPGRHLFRLAVPQFELVAQNLAGARNGKRPTRDLLDALASLNQSRGRIVSELLEKDLLLGRTDGALASPMAVSQQGFDTTLAPLPRPKGLA